GVFTGSSITRGGTKMAARAWPSAMMTTSFARADGQTKSSSPRQMTRIESLISPLPFACPRFPSPFPGRLLISHSPGCCAKVPVNGPPSAKQGQAKPEQHAREQDDADEQKRSPQQHLVPSLATLVNEQVVGRHGTEENARERDRNSEGRRGRRLPRERAKDGPQEECGQGQPSRLHQTEEEGKLVDELRVASCAERRDCFDLNPQKDPRTHGNGGGKKSGESQPSAPVFSGS